KGVARVARRVVSRAAGSGDGACAGLVLDGVHGPGTAGTLIRAAAWFGADAVLCGPGTADPESPKAARSAAGALWDLALVRLSAPVAYGAALDGLRARGLPLWGADLEGEPAAAWAPPREGVLVLGSEGHGLSAEAAARLDGRVRIAARRPVAAGRSRGVESVGVAVAGGIRLHRWLGGWRRGGRPPIPPAPTRPPDRAPHPPALRPRRLRVRVGASPARRRPRPRGRAHGAHAGLRRRLPRHRRRGLARLLRRQAPGSPPRHRCPDVHARGGDDDAERVEHGPARPLPRARRGRRRPRHARLGGAGGPRARGGRGGGLGRLRRGLRPAPPPRGRPRRRGEV